MVWAIRPKASPSDWAGASAGAGAVVAAEARAGDARAARAVRPVRAGPQRRRGPGETGANRAANAVRPVGAPGRARTSAEARRGAPGLGAAEAGPHAGPVRRRKQGVPVGGGLEAEDAARLLPDVDPGAAEGEDVEALEVVRDRLGLQGQPADVVQVLPDHGEGRRRPGLGRGLRRRPQTVEDEVGGLDAVGLGEDPADLGAQPLGEHVAAAARSGRRVVDAEVVIVGRAHGLGAGVDDLADPQLGGGLHHVPGAGGVDVEAVHRVLAHDREVHDRVHAPGRLQHLLVGAHVHPLHRAALRVVLHVGEAQLVVLLQARGEIGPDQAGGAQEEDLLHPPAPAH